VMLVGVLSGPATNAEAVTYDFSGANGSGSFSYDDAAVYVDLSPPGLVPELTWYPARSFVVNGMSLASPIIGIYDNTGSTAVDCMVLATTEGTSDFFVWMCGSTALFSGDALSNANDRELSEFYLTDFRPSDSAPRSPLMELVQRAQILGDVLTDYGTYAFIETLAATNIASGCGGGKYCPLAEVTRAQMAVFLERGMRGSDFRPPAAKGTSS